MTTALTVRPSKMPLVKDCLGSVEAQAKYPWEDSIYAKQGRAKHDVMALLFSTGNTPKTWTAIAANKEIAKEDHAKLLQTYEVGMSQMPDDDGVKTLVEESLDLEFLGMSGGKPDLVFISPKYKAAVIIDWKFGSRPVEDPDQNAQMQIYAIGIMAKYPDLQSVEGVIIQPWNNNPDEWYKSHTWSAAELRELAKLYQVMAKKAKTPGAPRQAGPHCDSGFCSARKSATAKNGEILIPCQAYLDYKAGKQEVKNQAHAQAVAAVTTVGDALSVAPDQAIPMPVIVINSETVAASKEKLELALSIRVTDEGTSQAAGKLSKDVRALASLIKNNRLSLTKPLDDYKKKIMDAEKQATEPLEAAAKHLDEQVDAYIKRQKALADEARKAEEAKIRAAEEARRKAEEEEMRRREEEAEALRKQQEALAKAAAAKTKAAREKAEKEAAEQRRLADEAAAKARKEQEARELAERNARHAEAAAAAVQAPPKVAGYRQAEQVTSTIPDVTKVPKQWATAVLVVDQKALDALVKQGKLNEQNSVGWLEIKRETVAVRSR